MWRRRRGRDRPTLITPLLIVSVVAMALLTMLAQSTFIYHRATAEKVLRDFAALAAGEFVRRSTAQIGFDGYLVLLPAAGRQVRPDGLSPDLPRKLAAAADPRVQRAAELARRFFVAAPGEDRIQFVPEAPSREHAAWILERLPASRHDVQGAFDSIHGVLANQPVSLVFAPAASARWELVGFEVELDRLQSWFGKAFEAGPLLPPSLSRGRVTNASLAVRVKDHAGVQRFRAGAGPWPELGTDVPFGPAYSGVLDGTAVHVSIDPQAARHLVIGGLPRSRLPVLLGLLALATVLVVTAILQLRKERAFQRLRAEFVASVSHELRTPLTQIRMFAETLLLDRVRSDEERRRSLEIIDREARRLTHLVENLLQFSRGERGALSIAPQQRALAPIVREVMEQFQPLIAGAGIRLSARLDEAAAAAVDVDALRQVLLNLLDNAVKYGPREQEVQLTLERAGAVVRLLSVDDQGPGIPPKDRRRVFERFQRLERDRHSAVAGAGIGLAVVRDLVERHGGRCYIEDGSRGGTRFVVELPAEPAAGPESPSAVAPEPSS